MCQRLEGAGARAGQGESPSRTPNLGKGPDRPQLWESPGKGSHAVFIRDLGAVLGYLGQMFSFQLTQEREDGKRGVQEADTMSLDSAHFLPTMWGARRPQPFLP